MSAFSLRCRAGLCRLLIFPLLAGTGVALPQPARAQAQSSGLRSWQEWNTIPDSGPLDDIVKKAGMAPITFPKTAITVADSNLFRLGWLKRTIFPVMLRELNIPAEGSPKKEVVEKLLGWWTNTDSRVMESKAAGLAFTSELDALAGPAVKAPVFQAIAAEYVASIGRNAEAVARERVTLAELDPKTGPAFAGLVALNSLVFRGAETAGSPAVTARLLRYLEAVISPEQCSEADAHIVVSFLGMERYTMVYKPVADQVGALFRDSKLPLWARQTLYGLCELQLAWNARGPSDNRGVTDAGWRGFAEHAEKARVALTEGWKLRPDRPEAALEMIRVAMAGNAAEDNALRVWFDRAVAAECDHPLAYDRMRWALRPRWNGSLIELAAFGIVCAQVDRPGCMVPDQLSQCLIDIVSEGTDWRKLFQDERFAGLLIKARQKLVAGAATPQTKNVQYGLLALDAWLCGQYEVAASALARTGDSRKQNFAFPTRIGIVLRRFQLDRTPFIHDCRLRGGPWAAQYTGLIAARANGKVEEAGTMIDELLKQTSATDDPMLVSLGGLTTFERALQKPGWVKLPLDRLAWREFTPGWNPAVTELRSAGAEPQNPLLFRGSLGERYEARAEVLMGREPAKKAFGVMLGAPGKTAQDGYLFLVSTEDGKSTVLNYGAASAKPLKTVKLGEPWTLPEAGQAVALRIRREGGQVSVWLGDRLILDKKNLLPGSRTGPLAFGLIATGGTKEDPVVFRGIEAKQNE